MTLVQLFDPEYCNKIKCEMIWNGTNNMQTCYGIPEECEANKKHGYPKVIEP